jgi:transketolase
VAAGVPQGWHQYVGPFGDVVAIEGRFGASAPWKVLAEKFGFTGEQVAARALRLLEELPARARKMTQTLPLS